MGANQLILAAAAGAVSLAICAVLWALAQRRQAQDRVAAIARKLATLEARAETAQASAEAFDSALLSVEDGRALLASGEESLAVCAAALGLSEPDPQGVVNALMRWGGDDLKRRLLPQLASRAVGAYALSEAGSGSDAFALTTLVVMRSTRRAISAAARREKVSSRMRRGSMPLTMRCATRCAKVLVLPEPAPAMISSGRASA